MTGHKAGGKKAGQSVVGKDLNRQKETQGGQGGELWRRSEGAGRGTLKRKSS